MGEPELWRWVWLVAAFAFVVGELALAGTFFLLPFGIGAAVAAVLAFAGVPVAVEWFGFVAVTTGAALALRPLARRLDVQSPALGVGAKRWQGELAVVLQDIPSHETGLVRVGREEWRAESVDGSAIEAGTTVRVVDLVGTRLKVWPLDRPITDQDTT